MFENTEHLDTKVRATYKLVKDGIERYNKSIMEVIYGVGDAKLSPKEVSTSLEVVKVNKFC